MDWTLWTPKGAAVPVRDYRILPEVFMGKRGVSGGLVSAGCGWALGPRLTLRKGWQAEAVEPVG